MKEAVSDKRSDPENKSRDNTAKDDLSKESGHDWEEETTAVSTSDQDNLSEETGILPDDSDGLVDNQVWTSLSDE